VLRTFPFALLGRDNYDEENPVGLWADVLLWIIFKKRRRLILD